MKPEEIRRSQTALAHQVTARLNESDGQYDMVSSTLMGAIASLEMAHQFALFNEALEKMGQQPEKNVSEPKGPEKKVPPPKSQPAPKAVPKVPEKPDGKIESIKARVEQAQQQQFEAKEYGVRGDTKTGLRNAPGGGPLPAKFKPKVRVVRPAKPPAPEVANLVAPPSDNYTPGFAGEVEEGGEMDQLLDRLGEE